MYCRLHIHTGISNKLCALLEVLTDGNNLLVENMHSDTSRVICVVLRASIMTIKVVEQGKKHSLDTYC